MSRQFMYGTVMAAALTVGLGAQSQSPSPSPQQYPPSSKPQSTSPENPGRGPMVTVVGCLQSGDQSATGTTGTAGSPASSPGERSSKFILADATQSPTGKTGAETGAAGTSGTTASIPSTLQLSASGNSSASWSKYLNHKVEVKGTLEQAMGGAEKSPAGNPPSASPANPPSTSSATGPTFRVTSIKEVAATCSSNPK